MTEEEERKIAERFIRQLRRTSAPDEQLSALEVRMVAALSRVTEQLRRIADSLENGAK